MASWSVHFIFILQSKKYEKNIKTIKTERERERKKIKANKYRFYDQSYYYNNKTKVKTEKKQKEKLNVLWKFKYFSGVISAANKQTKRKKIKKDCFLLFSFYFVFSFFLLIIISILTIHCINLMCLLSSSSLSLSSSLKVFKVITKWGGTHIMVTKFVCVFLCLCLFTYSVFF